MSDAATALAAALLALHGVDVDDLARLDLDVVEALLGDEPPPR